MSITLQPSKTLQSRLSLSMDKLRYPADSKSTMTTTNGLLPEVVIQSSWTTGSSSRQRSPYMLVSSTTPVLSPKQWSRKRYWVIPLSLSSWYSHGRATFPSTLRTAPGSWIPSPIPCSSTQTSEHRALFSDQTSGQPRPQAAALILSRRLLKSRTAR